MVLTRGFFNDFKGIRGPRKKIYNLYFWVKDLKDQKSQMSIRE